MQLPDPARTDVERLQSQLTELERINTSLRRELAHLRVDREKELLEFRLLRAQKLESLGRLAGGIAHRFNNLLTGILGNLGLLKAELGNQPRVSQFLFQIEQAAGRAAEVCKQMLAYTGRGSFLLEPLDLNQVLVGLRDLILLSISDRVVLKQQLGEHLPKILADSSQLRQVVVNLVTNASEAMGERGGELTITTGETKLEAGQLATTQLAPNFAPGRFVYLEIKDTGPGIPEDVLGKIFDPFFTTKFAGRGLGLAVVLGIARGHGGAIEVQSAPSLGSRLRVYWPLASASVPATAAPAEPVSGMAHVTALVVDDEAFVRTVAARMLEGMGFRVIYAADGVEALDKFERAQPEIGLVLLDLTMPRLNGERTLQRLRELDPHVPVILMSGYRAEDLTFQLTEKGLAGFLQKPFRQEDLERLVRIALGKKETNDSLSAR